MTEPASGRRARRRGPVVAVGVVVLVLAAGVGYAVWPRAATEVTREEALEDFTDRSSGSGDEPASVPAGAATRTPTPGVYTYSASGTERIQLGPLPAEERTLAERITAVVVAGGEGCFDWTVNFFAEHTEDTRYCATESDAGSLLLDSHVKHQSLGALSPTGTMSCDPSALPTVAGVTAPLRCTLTLEGGPLAISAVLEGTATASGPETVTVGGDEVAAVRVDTSFDVTGDLGGTWRESVWWTEEHLAVRVERELELAGPATFTESSRLELTELRPAQS